MLILFFGGFIFLKDSMMKDNFSSWIFELALTVVTWVRVEEGQLANEEKFASPRELNIQQDLA